MTFMGLTFLICEPSETYIKAISMLPENVRMSKGIEREHWAKMGQVLMSQ